MNSKEAMKLACSEVGVKNVAQAMEVSPSALYNQINDESKNDILYRFVDFCNACQNDVAIKWACEDLNGIFVKNPDLHPDKEGFARKCVPAALKEFSDVIKEIADALEDGVITKDETQKIRKEWEELKTLLESFILLCEYSF